MNKNGGKVRSIDKTMISPPSDFRHLAHLEPDSLDTIDNLKKSPVIDSVNRDELYMKPFSSLPSKSFHTPTTRIGLDSVFPANNSIGNENDNIRSYANQPTSHQYQNTDNQLTRPSKKNYKAPSPPPRGKKTIDMNEKKDDNSQVVFRIQQTKKEEEIDYIPKISTPDRVEAPKKNSTIIDRPGMLGGQYHIGLDDYVPFDCDTPLHTIPTPITHIPIHGINLVETPILSSTSPNEHDTNYLSTIRSSSAQGKEILDDLDVWLDKLDADDKKKLSSISTDESGYPTMILEEDRAFMKKIIEKYSMGDIEPETIRIRSKKKMAAPNIPTRNQYNIPEFTNRTVSMPVHPPNRSPPPYDVPSFKAPTKWKQQKTTNLTKEYQSEDEIPQSLAKYMLEKKKRAPIDRNQFGTISSGKTDYSTTSTRSITLSFECLSENGEEEQKQQKPIPLPRNIKNINNKSTEEEEGNYIEKVEIKMDIQNQIEIDLIENEEKSNAENIPESEVDEDDYLVITRF